MDCGFEPRPAEATEGVSVCNPLRSLPTPHLTPRVLGSVVRVTAPHGPGPCFFLQCHALYVHVRFRF